MKGGVKWKSGADTCVFKPAVKCAGEDAPRSGISRVTTKEAGAYDITVESLIREHFPHLVANNSVTIHDVACVPEFTEEDRGIAEDYGGDEKKGCKQLEPIEVGVKDTLVNLVTQLRASATMNEAITSTEYTLSDITKIRMLRPALLAAVDMVPDSGPWIIHGDCHLNNVLLVEGKASLADWGRTLIIEDPSTNQTIRTGILNWIRRFTKTPALTRKLLATFREQAGAYPQHPSIIVDPIVAAIEAPTDISYEIARRTMRGFVSFVLLSQVFGTASKFIHLLACETNAELRQEVTKIINRYMGIGEAPRVFGGTRRRKHRKTRKHFKKPLLRNNNAV